MVDCSDDTIAAIASATGGALRGIVRLAGANCAQVVEKLFAPLAGERRLSEVKRARRVAGCLELGHPLGAVPAHILLWPGARSYVRQPSAEIHTLGSPPLLAQLLERLCQSGVRIARPGEFTLRAFLAGRIDLTQAEAVLGVIDARDQRELHGALTQLAGGLSGPLFAIRSGLLDLLAHLEAGLDFVDEDIEFISKEELDRRLQDAAGQIERLANQLECRGITGSLPRVVLAGPPNAGKSSLLNALCGNPQAIVSAVAGTTRDYVSVRTRCGELEVELIDTAGIDESVPSGSVAAAARDIAQAQAESADLLLVCHEEPHPAGSGGDNCLLVLTKCDQPTERREIIPGTFLTSSRTGQGIEPLKAAIESSLAAQSPDVPMVASTAARCRESLLLAADSLNRAQAAANAAGEEFVAAEVRCALDDLGRVVGAIYTDDVLDRIFTSFCIGK